MKFIARFLLNVLVLLVMAEYVAGISVESLYSAAIAIFVLGLLNTIVKPILLLLTLPITIVTLGLFTFVINAAIFMFAASFLEGFAVQGFWIAMLGSLILSIASTVGARWIK